jgi:hypothetical protein
MKIFVVCPDNWVEGLGEPEFAFWTNEEAEIYVDQIIAKQNAEMKSGTDYEKKCVELDPWDHSRFRITEVNIIDN